MRSPKVSVSIITYNQKDFIIDCIESILVQSFKDLEIVIGDDCSTDGTSEICKHYQNKYPNLIKYYRRSENLGMMGNWIATLKNCSGEYIALCEGDDYWTDPLKLQKQVDFMEAHPDYSIIAHNVQIIGQEFGRAVNTPYHKGRQSGMVSTLDLIQGFRLPTNSILYRAIHQSSLFQEAWMLQLRSADKCLYLTLAHQGPVYYEDALMAAYRKHPGGVVGSYDQWTFAQHHKVHQNQIFFWNHFKRYFYPKYQQTIRHNIAQEYARLAQRSFEHRSYGLFLRSMHYTALNDWATFKALWTQHRPLLKQRLNAWKQQQYLQGRIWGSRLKQGLLKVLGVKP